MKHSIAVLVALAATSLAAQAAGISGVTVHAFSSQITAAPRLAASTANGNGLTGGGGIATDTHSANSDFMWLTAGSITAGGFGNGVTDFDPSITYNLGALNNLTTLRIWNFSETGFTMHGAREILVSAGATAAELPQTMTITLNQGGGTGTEPAQDFASSFTNVQFVKLTINTNYDGDNFVTDTFAGSGEQFAGLSEVRFEGAPVPEPGSLSLIGGLGAAALLRRRRV
jgi:hypothetical protein